MDAQSEVAFLRQLKEAVGGQDSTCTLIMVTHRRRCWNSSNASSWSTAGAW
ncbi:MAG: hypothetical protein U1F25_07080 [Rubrivivax sp.]